MSGKMVCSCESALNINIDNVNIKKNPAETRRGMILTFAGIFVSVRS